MQTGRIPRDCWDRDVGTAEGSQGAPDGLLLDSKEISGTPAARTRRSRGVMLFGKFCSLGLSKLRIPGGTGTVKVGPAAAAPGHSVQINLGKNNRKPAEKIPTGEPAA